MPDLLRRRGGDVITPDIIPEGVRRRYRLAANLEWLFTEAGDGVGERVRAAARQGFDAVEIWGWRNKDLAELRAALEETSVELLSLVVDPQLNLTDRATHDDFVRLTVESLDVALRLGSPNLVVVAGADQTDLPRAQQRAAVIAALDHGSWELKGSGVRLLLEPLNSRVDHIGTFLDSTSEGLEIVREVGRPELRLLLDAYHALVMEENLETELAGSIDLIGHVQIADTPGRHEPGSGSIDWSAQLALLSGLGYDGAFGLEYVPTGETADSLVEIERISRGIG